MGQCKQILDIVAGLNEQVMQVVQNVTCRSSYMQNMMKNHRELPGQDQQPATDEGHNPTAETGIASAGQQTVAHRMERGGLLQMGGSLRSSPSEGIRMRSIVSL